MKKLFASFAIAASVVSITGCSNEIPGVEPGTGDGDNGKFYTTLTLSMPEGTRSSTITPDDNTNSDSGYEVGLPEENKVGSVLVVIASKDDNGKYTYVTSSIADGKDITTNKARPTYSVAFQSSELIDMAGETVYLFTYCNPTAKLVEDLQGNNGSDFTDLTGLIADGSISGDNAFLMSNKEIVEKTLPQKSELTDTYNTVDNPYPLGTVKVARATARFDFKPITTTEGLNTYTIFSENGESGKKTAFMYVTLDGMALMNEAKEYYYLPRVSADGMDANITLCGEELPFLTKESGDILPGTYVVSPNVDKKIANPLDLTWVNGAYNYTYFTQAGDAFDFSMINYDPIPAKGDGVKEDNPDDTTWKGTLNKSGYIIWKYVTENTIPGIDSQRKGITTGIVFRGYLTAAMETDVKIKAAMKEGRNLFAFNNSFFGDFEMLKSAVAAAPTSNIAESFKTAFGLDNLDNLDNLDESKITAANGFTVYRSTMVNGKPTYHVYYTYFNRHNDNGNNTVMGPMEFAVVRNNVYKLSVAKINFIGHPGDPKDDPDPEKPGDPDETPKTYFTVNVEVVPWVVRVNDIHL